MSEVRQALRGALRAQLDALGAPTVEAIVEPSARPEFGDWSTPAPLRAARVLRRSPLQIATELCELLRGAGVVGVADFGVSPPGYVNARLDVGAWAPRVIAAAIGLDPGRPLVDGASSAAVTKTVVEHTSINTNKAAHIGHLRNACIGDTVARMLRRIGEQVEVQNYIDDTGAQVADVVVGLRELGLSPQPDEPFDQFCSRAYVEVMRRYRAQPELVERRRAVLREIEARDNETASFAKDLAHRVVAAHLRTMARFGIGYDLLTWESDILELGFWEAAFRLLRDASVIVHVETGKNAGCWVLPHVEGGDLDELGEQSPTTADGRDVKVLVKSDGVATYTAKDIAYQLWKFSLLGVDFHYQAWSDAPGSPATTRSSAEGADRDSRGYGGGQRVITVIDARQAYPQEIVRIAIARLGHLAEAERSVHLGYEVVALTQRAARELGIAVDPTQASGVALSGRQGIEVRADDLLDRAIARVAEKARDTESALALATGAVRWYLLRFTLPVQIVFDFDEALRTTGDTGVYVQYAHARACGILRRVEPVAGRTEGGPVELHPAERALLHRIDAYADELAEAVSALAPAVLTAYAFSLASAFTDFYERTPPMAREQDDAIRGFRRALVDATRATLADVLGTLGMAAPDAV